VSNAFALQQWSENFQDVGSFTSLYQSLLASAEVVNNGDLSGAEAVLTAQVASLNGLYTTLLVRSKGAQYAETQERYLRYALRAQSQCRATCEALALLKNPPVFANQANIAHGPQQVNNRGGVNGRARAETIESEPNKLLEASTGGERLVSVSAAAAAEIDSAVAPVGVVNGAAHTRR
jgi:hypothetical protein